MLPWLDLLTLIFKGAIITLFEPMFWLVLALVGLQYWQMQKNQLKMFGVYGYSLKQQIILAGFYGLIGGLIGSFLLTVVGVPLNNLGLNYLWPAAIALSFINMRFLCFAYAGGLIAISNILFGWPEINPSQVLALVAILHITESFLIYISGRYSAVPLILRRPDGRLVGAFNLQNFWPLPLVLLAAVAVPENVNPGAVVDMPDWWPLLPLGANPPEGQRWIYAMLPVVAALGYTDVSVANPPSRRRRISAVHLALYSIALLVLAIASARYEWLQIFAAVLSPVGHEALIRLDSKREMEGKPLFVPPDYGVMVLDTVPDSPARKLGLRPGDIIFNIGGIAVGGRHDLAYAISAAPLEFTLDFYRDGRTERRSAKFNQGQRQLGIIPAPQGDEQDYVEMANDRFGILDWAKNKLRRRG